LHEKFSRLRTAYDLLLSLIAHVDAEIDFGESDSVEIQDFDDKIQCVTDSLTQLLQDSTNRRENAGYFTVALTGPPNVGKSSLFNALLRHERSIVSEIPGTTRDYVESFIDVSGFRVKLIDTAGIREADESLESRGIELGKRAATHADITLRLTVPDDRTPAHGENVLLLHNKIDLDHWTDGLCVSAISGEGINAFHKWLFTQLGKRSSELSLVNLSESERSKLSSILIRFSELTLMEEPAILSEELRNASADLADLLGLNTSSESLDFIFAKMCIGK
jgi:tRNA modification GTPase